MDEVKIVKLAELRRKLGAIPGKLIVSILLFGVLYQFDFKAFMEKPLINAFALIVLYGIASYFWACVRATGNWLIGFIVAFVLMFIWLFNVDKLDGWLSTLIGCVICFGGVVMDIISIIRYFLIKKSLFRSYRNDDDDYEEEAWEQSRDESREQSREESRQQASPGFFSDCKDEASIKRRYKDLCKVYHPDSGNGSADIFNRITEEYNILMGKEA